MLEQLLVVILDIVGLFFERLRFIFKLLLLMKQHLQLGLEILDAVLEHGTVVAVEG